MTTPRIEPSTAPATPSAHAAPAASRRAAVATTLSLLSTLVYFICSDGIRNYLLLIGKACAALAKRLS